MIIAVPAPSSRLYDPISRLATAFLADGTPPHPRSLLRSSGDDSIVYCRGFDIPLLVAQGIVDLGITGYDVCVEFSLAHNQKLVMRGMPAMRTSFVSYCTVSGRVVQRIYTEYPAIAQAWLASRTDSFPGDILQLRGAAEGVIRADPQGAGVLLVTSGETLGANGLDLDVPLLATDVCAVARTVDAIERVIASESLSELDLPSFCADASTSVVRRQGAAGGD